MMEKVDAFVVNSVNGAFEPAQVFLDTTVTASDVLVDVVASGVCHSDLSWQNGTMPTVFPCILGHEGAGIVRKVGSAVTRCKAGDKVLLSWAYCRNCPACATGHPSRCYKWRQYNSTGLRAGEHQTYYVDESFAKPIHGACLGQSSFSHVACVDESSVILVTTPISLPELTPLCCGLITGSGTIINVANPSIGDTVVVTGVGAVGAGAIMAAKLRGVIRIIAVDLVPERLALAKEIGATHTINGREENMMERIKELTGGRGAEYVIECTGVAAVLKQGWSSLCVGGAVISLGLPPAHTELSINILEHVGLQKRFLGVVEGDCDPNILIPQLIALHEQGRYPYDKLVKLYDFNQIEQAFADMKSGKVIKPVLVWK